MGQAGDFSGKWRSTHWYPTHDDQAEDSSVYEMQAHQRGEQVVFESAPEKNGAYLVVRLSIDGDVASGSWHEHAGHPGVYHGLEYSGAGQLLISPNKRKMEGLWVGAGLDRNAGKLKIYTGRWEFERIE